MPADLVVVPLIAFAVAVVLMLGELWLSRRNERILLARGAVYPPDPVFRVMRAAYPGVFAMMAIEGALIGGASRDTMALGALLFVAAKLFKAWAIATLGVRWTYRVLVLPGAPLVGRGPYRFMRHPNYLGVVGEMVGFALLTGARWSGPLGTLFFSWLMWRRVVAEERALGVPR